MFLYSLLLPLIYAAFISLGLPDSLLGSAWPLMVDEFNVQLSYAGIISMIISGGTIISSLFSDRFTRKFGAGLVTAVSVGLTAAALLGFSISNSFWLLCFLAVPYGLGAGAVDAALNNFVALHYSSRHMSWLHCFWGIGATTGPYIMGWAIGAGHGWRFGYWIISMLQIVLTFMLFMALPMWKNQNMNNTTPQPHTASIGLIRMLSIGGVKEILIAFFGYCAFESTAGLWASSYLVACRGVASETAAFFASLFFLGITLGRFLCGFIVDLIGDKNIIRIGTAIMTAGIMLIAIPVPVVSSALVGLVILGIGAAPVYPSIIHSTPVHFGSEHSHAIVGVQMASAYCGSTFVPPIFGCLAQYIHIKMYPYFLAIFVLLLLVMTEQVNKICNVSHDTASQDHY